MDISDQFNSTFSFIISLPSPSCKTVSANCPDRRCKCSLIFEGSVKLLACFYSTDHFKYNFSSSALVSLIIIGKIYLRSPESTTVTLSIKQLELCKSCSVLLNGILEFFSESLWLHHTGLKNIRIFWWVLIRKSFSSSTFANISTAHW